MTKQSRWKHLYVDCETASLDPTSELWCVGVIDMETGEETLITKGGFDTLAHRLRHAEVLVGHNAVSFDHRVLKYHILGSLDINKWQDTLIMAQVDDPRRDNSLGNLAKFVNMKKLDFDDFAGGFTTEMGKYCMEDCRVGVAVYHWLVRNLMPHSRQAIELEHDLQIMCEDMKTVGLGVDVGKLDKLEESMEHRLIDLNSRVSLAFPPAEKHEVFVPKRDNKSKGYKKGVPFIKKTQVPFKMNSPKQVVERLNEFGWKPYVKTEGHKKFLKQWRGKKMDAEAQEQLAEFKRTGWKVCPENLETIPASAPPECKLIPEYMMLKSRMGVVKGYRDALGTDQRMHGNCRGLGASTHRASHNSPNLANVPGKKSPYGRECRELIVPREGWSFVGTDADAIQLRILAHLSQDEDYIKEVATGDVHTRNMEALGGLCKDRDTSKTFIYAWVLNAGDDKIAQILGCTVGEAREAKAMFLNNTPGLKYLKEEWVPRQTRQGYILGPDGRHMRVDNDHYVLATALQGFEKIIMATAMRRWQEALLTHGALEKGIDWNLVAFVHDEWLTETPYVNTVAIVQEESLPWAGKELGILTPLKGQAKIGNNWYEVH